MPGFIIDTPTDGADEDGKPHIELYYSPDDPVSLIQKTAVESIDKYGTTMYDISNKVGRVQSKQIRTAPTTIVLDGGYEIERWETTTHADVITEVLDKW